MKLSEKIRELAPFGVTNRQMLDEWADEVARREAELAECKEENDALREYVELTQSKWEWFESEDGIVTVKYPWAIQERLREIALLTEEDK